MRFCLGKDERDIHQCRMTQGEAVSPLFVWDTVHKVAVSITTVVRDVGVVVVEEGDVC